jgi:Domain of unknown function (DUF4942)/Methyltransferase small domain
MSDVLDVEQASEFFAPVSSDLIDSLVGQYNQARDRIDYAARIINGEECANVIHYFLDGNRNESRFHADGLFEPKGAIAALNSAYWSKTLGLTDVFECMPQKRRDEWNKSIVDHSAPDFKEETVRATLTDLLNMRQQFMAEKVDGIFRGLSGEHVTNSPEAFGKRMIISYVSDNFGYSNHSRAGLIHDLRHVIAKFMGRDQPHYSATEALLSMCRSRRGEWISCDGGALRIRTYKIGTGHLEVHPDMAWRLNLFLHSLYPAAIPAEFRQKPKRRAKQYTEMQRPIPFAAIQILHEGMHNRRYSKGNEFAFGYEATKKDAAYQEACRILSAIGGTPRKGGGFDFEYNPSDVIREIIVSGCIPDKQAYQFYPTPLKLAKIAVDLAEIGPADICLEPSAGQGGLASLMPRDRTTCVELSELHCDILRARGLETIKADFIQWADERVASKSFDRIVMNPPFSDGRAQLHIEYAYSLLKPGGRLVAILPASMQGKQPFSDAECIWSRPYDGEFAGTSVSVAILVANRSPIC